MAQPETSCRFKPGDRVRVSDRVPTGHCRTPSYLRGKTGIVDCILGAFRNPEELAYYRPGLPKQPLYIVRFRQSEVWPGYAGAGRDTVAADIYEHWLEPADERVTT
jgi:nitrile hydratase